jgi:hypothetical protein
VTRNFRFRGWVSVILRPFWGAVPGVPRKGSRTALSQAAKGKEMTWPRAVVMGLIITGILLILLAWIPSHFTYFWWEKLKPAELLQKLTGHEFQPYTLVRIRDNISMGYQTVVFAIPVIATYVIMEKRRRQLGQRGADDVKGYLPGK